MKELYLIAAFLIVFILMLTTLLYYQNNRIASLKQRIKLYKDPKTFVNIFHCLSYQADTVEQFKNQNDYLFDRLRNPMDEQAQALKPWIEEKIKRNSEFAKILEQRLDF